MESFFGTPLLYFCISKEESDDIIYQHKIIMSKVFRITPKAVHRANGTVLTPEMSIIVTTKQHTSDPFYNGAVEIQEAYMRQYGFDFKKACCNKGYFTFEKLD